MNEFDLMTFLRALKKGKWKIILSCFFALVLGVVVAWSIPKEYLASCSIVPEVPEEGGLNGGGLSSLASMAGINLGAGTDAIGPELYPDVVSSNPFVIDVLYVEVTMTDGARANYFNYLKKHCKKPWWAGAQVWFGNMMKKLNPQPVFNTPSADGRISPERMSKDEEKVVEKAKGSMGCRVDEKSGVITLSARAQDPLVAKTLVDTITQHLQNFITEYRTSKARTDLEYYRSLEAEARRNYDKAQLAYADYCDTHKDVILQAYISEQERLENDLSVALQTFTQMKQQVQMAEAKVQEKTPAFTIIERATVPNLHASPKKLVILIAFLFVAFVGSVGIIYIKLLFSKPQPVDEVPQIEE